MEPYERAVQHVEHLAGSPVVSTRDDHGDPPESQPHGRGIAPDPISAGLVPLSAVGYWVESLEWGTSPDQMKGTDNGGALGPYLTCGLSFQTSDLDY